MILNLLPTKFELPRVNVIFAQLLSIRHSLAIVIIETIPIAGAVNAAPYNIGEIFLAKLGHHGCARPSSARPFLKAQGFICLSLHRFSASQYLPGTHGRFTDALALALAMAAFRSTCLDIHTVAWRGQRISRSALRSLLDAGFASQPHLCRGNNIMATVWTLPAILLHGDPSFVFVPIRHGI